MKKLSKQVIILLLGILVVGTFLFIHNISKSKAAPALHATGIIDGIEVNLSSKAAGRISWTCCNEGDTVKEGQTVITLENDDIKASVAQATAGVERAKADINTAEASVENARANILSAEADINSAASDVEKARTQMEEAKREAERAKELYRKDFISKESRDQIVTGHEVNIASFNSSKEKLNSVRARKDVAASQLKAAASQLNSSKAMIKEAEANLVFYRSKLNDMTITTPVTGTVIFKSLEKGETVSPGVTIATIVDLNSLYARIDIDETRIGTVVLNSPVFVTVEAVPGKTFKGKVSEIGRYAGFATQRDVVRGREDIKTFRVKVRIDDATGTLKPGMTVSVEIPRKS